MGATTRDPDFIILVESGTPPIFKDLHTMGAHTERVKAPGRTGRGAGT